MQFDGHMVLVSNSLEILTLCDAKEYVKLFMYIDWYNNSIDLLKFRIFITKGLSLYVTDTTLVLLFLQHLSTKTM